MPFLQIHYKKVLMCIFLVSLCPGLVIARACSRVWQMLVSALGFSLQRLASIRRLTRVGYSVQWRNYNTNITWIFCPPRQEFAPRPLTWTWSRTEQPSSSYANTVVNWKTLCLQWRRFTRARQVKWPGWKIHRPGSALAPPWLRPAYWFASFRCEQKIKILPYLTADRFICFILAALAAFVFWERRLKRSSTFEKKCIRVTWLEDVLTSKHLAPLLRWRRHCLFTFNVTEPSLHWPSAAIHS